MVERVVAGAPFDPKADDWNTIGQATEYVQEQMRLGAPVAVTPAIQLFDRLKVRNDTGSNLAAGLALEVGTKIPTTLTQRALWFVGGIPAPDGTKIWGIAPRAIPSGAFGDLITIGNMLATVSVGHASHTHADVQSSSTTLLSGFHGFPIVYKPSGTGTLECVIRLGAGYERGPLDGKNDSTITSGSSGTVSIWLEGTDSGANETGWADWMTAGVSIGSGKEVTMFWFPRRQRWGVRERQCP